MYILLYTVNPLHPHFIVDSKKGDFLILVLNDISGLGGFKVLIQGKNLEHFDVRDLNSDVFWPQGLEFPQVKNVHMANARQPQTWETNFF